MSSESPGYFSRSSWFSFAKTSRRVRCSSTVNPAAGFRSMMGSPEERNAVPWYAAGMKPAVQLLTPPIGPPRMSGITTKAGKPLLSEPNP